MMSNKIYEIYSNDKQEEKPFFIINVNAEEKDEENTGVMDGDVDSSLAKQAAKELVDGFKKDVPTERGDNLSDPVLFIFWTIILVTAIFTTYRFIMNIIHFFNAKDPREKEMKKQSMIKYGIALLIVAAIPVILILIRIMFSLDWSGVTL